MQQAHDFLEEAATLAGLLENQSENVFNTVTLFKSWTINDVIGHLYICLLYTSPSPRDATLSRMPSSA